MNVLILGATGWIGSATLVNMLEKYSDLKLTLVSSKKNIITFKKPLVVSNMKFCVVF